MMNYGIGGNEVQTDASEAFADIPQNRTLMAEKLTKDAPVKPEVVHGLQTVEQVFGHYKPELGIDFTDAEGVTKKETLKFTNLGDFGVKGITEQSAFLKDNQTQKDEYLKIMKQLKTNKILKAALTDADAKQALLDAINGMIAELKNNK
jgi:hypothetical protein